MNYKKITYICTANAQMAESVDALVSNTSGAIHPGSIPGLGTGKIGNPQRISYFFATNHFSPPAISGSLIEVVAELGFTLNCRDAIHRVRITIYLIHRRTRYIASLQLLIDQ